MVEKVVLDYLKEKLDVDVSMERRANAPEKYVLVEKIGSKEENYIETATLAIRSFAESMYEAAVLNGQVKTMMKNIVELPDVSKCSCGSDYNYTDTTAKKYCYRAAFNIVYLGGNES